MMTFGRSTFATVLVAQTWTDAQTYPTSPKTYPTNSQNVPNQLLKLTQPTPHTYPMDPPNSYKGNMAHWACIWQIMRAPQSVSVPHGIHNATLIPFFCIAVQLLQQVCVCLHTVNDTLPAARRQPVALHWLSSSLLRIQACSVVKRITSPEVLAK